jgi:hypothetical protein
MVYKKHVSNVLYSLMVSVISILMTKTSRKVIAVSDSISIENWMEGLKLLKWLRKFLTALDHEAI